MMILILRGNSMYIFDMTGIFFDDKIFAFLLLMKFSDEESDDEDDDEAELQAELERIKEERELARLRKLEEEKEMELMAKRESALQGNPLAQIEENSAKVFYCEQLFCSFTNDHYFLFITL